MPHILILDFVMPGLDLGIHDLALNGKKDLDGRS
jgi:hypothetical protein